MFAILRNGSLLASAIDTQEEYNQKFLDIINCITGVSYSFSKYDNGVCYINSTVSSGWSVVWSSVALNSFAGVTDIRVLLRSVSRISGKYIYAKLYRDSSGYIYCNTANRYNETTGVVSSGYENSTFGHYDSMWASGFYPARHHLAWLSDLTIKAVPGVLLFNHFNLSVNTQFNGGVIERTATAPYETVTDENPVVPFLGLNNAAAVSRLYNPATDTYTDGDARANTSNYAMYASNEIKLTRDATGNKVLPLVPIIYTDPRIGYVGGSLSVYSGLYRTAHYSYHNLSNNDTFSHDSKTYRIWNQYNYTAPICSFAITEN